MLDALRNALRIGDLRRKLLYTAALLVVFRIGSFVPVPGVDAIALAESLDIGGGNIFGFLNMFTGGALGRFTIFAMGVNPYITASIILQLLTIVIPQLEELAKEGIEGRKKIQQYTRYGTVLLGLIQAYGITVLARNSNVITNPTFFSLLLIVITLTAGTSFLMWLGEKISENGIGNGISMIIFAGIVAEFPVGIIQAIQKVGEGGISIFSLIVLAVLFVVIIAAVVHGAGGTAAHPGAVRQAGGGPQDVRGPVHAHPLAGEQRRRHPRHLRLVGADLPADAGAVHPGHRAGGDPVVRHRHRRATWSPTHCW